MRYHLKYGRQEIGFDLARPATEFLASPSPQLVQNDEIAIIEQALDRPVGSLPLEQIVRKGEKTCIVVPDRTRVCRASVFLPRLLARLNACGITDQDITILMANGSHRKNTAAEQIEILGKTVVDRIRIIEHDAQDATALVHLGETDRGTQVFINKNLIRAERIILTGGVLHHYFAGFGGGPKLVCPGCAGYATIVQNHRFTIHPYFQALHPACYEGNFDENPVHLDIRDTVKFVTVDFSLHVVTDSDGLISQAFAGELYQAHQQACQTVHAHHSIAYRQKTDLVIADSGGYPKDLNYIQVHKALHHAFELVKPGGALILLAECRDGIGSGTFLEWFDGAPDLATMHQRLLAGFKINGNTALATKIKTDAAHIILVSGMDAELVKMLGMFPADSIETALELARTYLPASFTTTVFPNAALYLPVHEFLPETTDSTRQEEILAEALLFVKERLGENITGHDWWHAWRVWHLAQKIMQHEGGDPLIIQLAALLHDVVDWKNIDSNSLSEKQLVRDWLWLKQLPKATIHHITEIIDSMSFKGAGVATEMHSLEGQIVQDADRLDAMGAIGIARTFAFGAVKGRPIFLPEEPAQFHETEAEYRTSHGTSLNHFYEKLLLLHERLNTGTAKKIGAGRHEFLQTYLLRFLEEWNGEDYRKEV